MKKIVKIIICLVLVIVLSGCGKKINKKQITTKQTGLGDLIFSVPNEFSKDENNTSETALYYSYTSSDGLESCFVGVFYSDVYTDDLDKLAKDNLYGTGDINVSDKSINNQNWKVAIAKQKDVITNYSYVTIHNNKYYSVTYNTLGNGDFCSNSYNTIINSLKFK